MATPNKPSKAVELLIICFVSGRLFDRFDQSRCISGAFPPPS
ncbi:hypothetical protein [Burkholderia glumae]|nr:hypothetical protein [Burkholderia glumae]